MNCWLARDGFGMLQLHHSKPIWDDKKEDWISGLKIGILSSLDFEFKDVTFENSPVKVEINFKNSKNMEKKINIAELLKNCPKGMELDCTLYDDVKFMEVDAEREYILLQIGNEFIKSLNKYGQQDSYDFAKCVIFPKGKTTWEGFISPCKFKGGDVLISEAGNTVLFSHIDSQNYVHYHCIISIHGSSLRIEKNTSTGVGEYYKCTLANEHQKQRMYDKIKGAGYKYNQNTNKLEKLLEFKDGDIVCTTLDNIVIIKNISGEHYSSYCGVFGNDDFAIDTKVSPMRLATEEEKQRLFKAIKENGYKWNPETKTLEKLPNKFKAGDKVKNKDNFIVTIVRIDGDYYNYVNENGQCGVIYIKSQNEWELVPPKFKVGDIIQDKARYKVKITEVNTEDRLYGYESLLHNGIGCLSFDVQDGWELVPNKFDTSSLIPYESKVLVRNSLDGYWKPAFWGAYVPENPERHQNRNFLTTLGFTRYCIPFEGNEALTGTTNDCNEFYKIWEE